VPPAGTDSSLSITTTIGLDGNEECPSSAVELQVKEKVLPIYYLLLQEYRDVKYKFCFLQFLKKLNRQERVVEEVRLALKPYYTSKRISKGDYKEILRKCVPKVSSPLLHRFLIS
jgi:PHD and RING finger domain-containing protein 1